MISKELLSEVLGLSIFNIEKIPTEKNIYYGYYSTNKQERSNEINIHELAYKCKEWASKKHRTELWSTLDGENYCICRIASLEKTEFYANTEPEAIFKACEWILKEIND